MLPQMQIELETCFLASVNLNVHAILDSDLFIHGQHVVQEMR
jgi:hypothetical protein